MDAAQLIKLTTIMMGNGMRKKGAYMKLKFGKILPCIAVTVLFLTGGSDSSLPEMDPQDEREGSLLDNETSSGFSINANSLSIQQKNMTQPDTKFGTEENMVEKMTLQIGNNTFTVALENNAAVDAFVEMMNNAPVIIQMSDYSGFEKVGFLGTNLPADDSQTTTHAGDIVLYNGNQIVIFYGSNSWSYTRLGKIDDLSGLEDALGSGDVVVTFSLE